MNITLEIQDSDTRAVIQRLLALSNDLTPITSAVSARLKEITEVAFEKEKDPTTGENWAELSEVTLARRKKAGNVSRSGVAKKLQVTRNLLDSIVADFDPKTAVVGTNTIYATTHQFGAKKGSFGYSGFLGAGAIPWGDIPARPFLGFSSSDGDAVEALVIDKIRELL